MKVYGCPDECAWSDPDYANYDFDKERKREEEHAAKLKAWLIEQGYSGQYTGEIFQEPHADGYAQYMMGDKAGKSILIHLPYGDGWDSRNVEFLPRAEVIRRIEVRKKWPKLPPMMEKSHAQ